MLSAYEGDGVKELEFMEKYHLIKGVFGGSEVYNERGGAGRIFDIVPAGWR